MAIILTVVDDGGSRCRLDWLPLLEISQNRVARGAGCNVLQSMPTQNRADRINRTVIEFEELREGI